LAWTGHRWAGAGHHLWEMPSREALHSSSCKGNRMPLPELMGNMDARLKCGHLSH
jgi:hypothetical protein